MLKSVAGKTNIRPLVMDGEYRALHSLENIAKTY